MRNSSCNLCSNWLQNPKLHKSYAYLLFALVNCPALCHNILQNCSGSSLPSFVAFFEAQIPMEFATITIVLGVHVVS